MTKDVFLRTFTPSDLPEVLSVLKAALGESPVLRRTPALWAWKHEQNPFGPSLVLLAEKEGRIAGVRALMRWDLDMPNGSRLRCLRAVDTATHPDFERQGIFSRLTTAALDNAREQGYDLIFNTPNERSGAGYLKMGWGIVGAIGVMIRPLLGAGRRVDEEAAPDPEHYFSATEVLPASLPDLRPPRGLRTPRTEAYLEWRFRAHPYVSYITVTAGSCMAVARPNLRKGRKEVVVSDLLGLASGKAVRMLARRSRAHYLAGWFSPGSPERTAAILGGMLPIPGMQSLTLVANPLRQLPLDVFDASNWDLAMSDLELL